MDMLKPLLSVSSSSSARRVGETVWSSSSFSRSSYVRSCSSRCGSLAFTSESRRFSDLLYAMIGGLRNIILSFLFLAMIFQFYNKESNFCLQFVPLKLII